MFPDKIKKVEELPKNVKNALEYFKLAAKCYWSIPLTEFRQDIS